MCLYRLCVADGDICIRTFMATFDWKILEISAENDVITHAKYHVTAKEDDCTVETEGNWWFNEPKENVPFLEVTEQMVAQWIEQEAVRDGISIIKSNLEDQLASLQSRRTVVPPWKPQIFKAFGA